MSEEMIGSEKEITTPENASENQVTIVGVRFKKSGKIYYFSPGKFTIQSGSEVIVDTARGNEFAYAVQGNTEVPESEIVPPLRPVIRVATDADRRRNEENQQREKEAFEICHSKIEEHKLDMKLIDVEYTFDRSKLLFYFTAEGRIDFRDLVKDLASIFRTRIELRQIGIRDEAKLLGGLGVCGRPFCCSTFLGDFTQVSIKMAKEQSLSLNSAKISGACGRLMCCLKYEQDTYSEEIKKTPKTDSIVQTSEGEGVVTESNPLAGTVKVRLYSNPDQPPKLFNRDDVIRTQKTAKKQNYEPPTISEHKKPDADAEQQ